MKNLFFLLVLCCTFSACTTSDDAAAEIGIEEPVDPIIVEPVNPDMELISGIVGKWQMSYFEITRVTPQNVPAGDIIMTLHANGVAGIVYSPTAFPLQPFFPEGTYIWNVDRGRFILSTISGQLYFASQATLANNELILLIDGASFDVFREFRFTRIP